MLGAIRVAGCPVSRRIEVGRYERQPVLGVCRPSADIERLGARRFDRRGTRLRCAGAPDGKLLEPEVIERFVGETFEGAVDAVGVEVVERDRALC